MGGSVGDRGLDALHRIEIDGDAAPLLAARGLHDQRAPAFEERLHRFPVVRLDLFRNAHAGGLDDTPGHGLVVADGKGDGAGEFAQALAAFDDAARSEEHTSELQSLMRISYAVFCLKKKNTY